MTSIQFSLLRRTAVIIAALTGLALSAAANAQSGSVRIQNSAGKYSQCTYSTMRVDPDGRVTVTCSSDISGDATAPTEPVANLCSSTEPTTFSLSSPGGTLAGGGSPSPALQVVRSGTCTGTYHVGYRVSGDACATPAAGAIEYAIFNSGDGAPKPINVTINSTGTSCTIALGVSGPLAGTLNATYTRQTSPAQPTVPGAPVVPAGCPALPSNIQLEKFSAISLHNKWVNKPSVPTVIIAPMPILPSNLNSAFMITFPQPAIYTPANGEVEYSISKCPGEIKSDYSDYCNVKTFISAYQQPWVPRATNAFPNKASAQASGICWAPESEGPYYLNARYNFPNGCNLGAETCGVVWQYY